MKKLIILLTSLILCGSFIESELLTSNNHKINSLKNSNQLFSINKIVPFDSNVNVTASELDANQNLWYVANNNVFFVSYKTKKVQEISGVQMYSPLITLDIKANCWVYSQSGSGINVIYVGATTVKFIPLSGSVNNIKFDSKNNAWIASTSGLYFIKNGTTTIEKITGTENEANLLNIDLKNNIWFGLQQDGGLDGLYLIKSGSKTINNLGNFNVSSIVSDLNGNCWVVSEDEIYYFLFESLTPIKIKDISSKSSIQQLSIDMFGNCWITTIGNELFFIKNGTTLAEKITINLMFPNIIKFDSKNNAWIVSTSGLYFIKNGTTTIEKIKDITNIINITIDKNDNVWVVGESGFSYFLLGDYTNYSSVNNIKNIYKINTTEQGNSWIISNDGVYYAISFFSWLDINVNLETLDNKSLVWLKPDELASNGIVNLKTTDQEINTIKVDGKTIPEVNKQWDFNINDIKEKSKNYNIEINTVIEGQNYNITFALSSLLSKPILSVETLLSNGNFLKPIWFQKNPNLDLKKTNPVSEAFVANTAVKLNLPNPTSGTTETATIYGLKSDFTKTGNSEAVTKNLQINGNELGTTNGLFEIEVKDDASNSFTYYLQVATQPTIANFFDTAQGKYFTHWASHNNYDQKYFDNLLKIDDSTLMNKIINDSAAWVTMATDIEIADNIESLLNAKTIINSETGLNSEELVKLLENQLPNLIQIKNEDTTDFNKTYIKITVDKPKNGKTYQDNEEVNYTITYNDATASTLNKIIITPYVAPIPTKYNYTWVIILASCLVILGLVYLAGWKYGFRKLLLKRKAIKEKLEEEEIIKMMKAEEVAKNG